MIIIIGKSGSGKTSVANELEKSYGYEKLITDTTRPMRNGEKDKVDYNFRTVEEFEELKNNGYYGESMTYNTKFGPFSYGSNKEYYKDYNEKSVIVLNPIGFYEVKNNKDLTNGNFISVYLKVIDENLLLNRLIDRDDDPEEIKRRWKADTIDFDGIENEVDYVVEVVKGKSVKELAKEINELNNRKKD